MADVPADTTENKKESMEMEITPKADEKPDPVSLLMEKLTLMENKLTEATKPKEKKKRQPSQKQLENLAKAREKRNANMVKRKEIKKDIKIQEKKLVNQKLKEQEQNVVIKQEEENVVVKDPPNNVSVEEQPNTPAEPTHNGNPNIPASAPIDIPQVKKPTFNFAARPYRRR